MGIWTDPLAREGFRLATLSTQPHSALRGRLSTRPQARGVSAQAKRGSDTDRLTLIRPLGSHPPRRCPQLLNAALDLAATLSRMAQDGIVSDQQLLTTRISACPLWPDRAPVTRQRQGKYHDALTGEL